MRRTSRTDLLVKRWQQRKALPPALALARHVF
jgi:hypothetical protein